MPFVRSALVLLAVGSLAWAEHEVQTLGNQTLKGKVVAITNQEVHVKEANGELKKAPLSQVLSVTLQAAGQPADDVKYTLLQLFDDSRLYCKDVAFQGNKVEATLLSGQKITVPLESLTGFLRDANDKNIRKQFEKLAGTVIPRDRLLIAKGGELNPLEGAIGDVIENGERIQFRAEVGNKLYTPKIANITGMIWHRIQTPDKVACLVIDKAGNTLAATAVAVKDGQYTVTTVSGDKVIFAEADLARLDYNRGKLTFLSEMEPSEVVERSRIGLVIHYRKDQSLDGQPIRFGGVVHSKGLSMHAHTELEYDLGGKYKELKFVLGADARFGDTENKAVVVIRADGAQIFSEQVNPLKAVPVALSVRNVNKLRIIVRSSNLLDLHDHATLADARVSQ